MSVPASGYATPLSASTANSSSTSLSKAPSKSKPVNVFSNDGSFLERFQRSKQEEEDRRKVEEALTKKRQFADRFKNRGKRPPPPDSSSAVTSTDIDTKPVKKPKLDSEDHVAQDGGHFKQAPDQAGRAPKGSSATPGPLVK